MSIGRTIHQFGSIWCVWKVPNHRTCPISGLSEVRLPPLHPKVYHGFHPKWPEIELNPHSWANPPHSYTPKYIPIMSASYPHYDRTRNVQIPAICCQWNPPFLVKSHLHTSTVLSSWLSFTAAGLNAPAALAGLATSLAAMSSTWFLASDGTRRKPWNLGI